MQKAGKDDEAAKVTPKADIKKKRPQNVASPVSQNIPPQPTAYIHPTLTPPAASSHKSLLTPNLTSLLVPIPSSFPQTARLARV